jgi:hypothetical protein
MLNAEFNPEKMVDEALGWAPSDDLAPGPQLVPPPLTLEDWLARELPSPDFVLGDILSTTTRGILFAPTGLGKTLFCTAAAFAMAAGTGFLGWKGHRPVRVLYIDGEMSQILFRDRMRDEAQRSGLKPEGFHGLSHDDIVNFQPLNTPVGQQQIEWEIERSGAEFVFFDNIMSLMPGEMKDEGPWRLALPWIKSLTRRHIGQLWLHHTGHDTSHGYGTKTREWQMDLVMGLSEVKREDTDVSFKLEFPKARERKPSNRQQFAARTIALVNDQWLGGPVGPRSGHVAPLTLKFYDALCSAIDSEKVHGLPAAPIKDWQAECIQMGLLDRAVGKAVLGDNSRALFSKERRLLIAANRIACNDTMAWLITEVGPK